jgi:polyphosphate glucokinase
MVKVKQAKKNSKLKTLAVDIGGSGVKMMLLDAAGRPLTERLRVPTPNPATPASMLAVLDEMKAQMPAFDRVSIGFPGVVKHGKTFTAHNLSPEWVGYPLEQTIQRKWKRPTRVRNDAAIQGYGAVKGKGVELVLTLGTGLGSSLFVNGCLCPGLELAHHPWVNNFTYEDFLGRAALKKFGKRRWNKLVAKAIEQTRSLFNWDALYLGGGNSTKITLNLPKDVNLVSNEDGLLGGVAIWNAE